MAARVAKDPEAHQAGSSALVRLLACTDRETRDKGVAVLTKWLKVKQSVSERDLLKIWKGLFYCMWHSDKAPVQAELASSLSGILLQLNLKLSLAYLSAFLVTIRREWPGIDSLRLDKFYLLIRMFLKRSFELLDAKGWDDKVVNKVVRCFSVGGFSAKGDKEHSIGVSLHLCDIFVGELLQSEGATNHALDLLLPLLDIMAIETDRRLVLRLQAAVFTEFLKQAQGGHCSALSPMVPTLAASILEQAGHRETPGYNRKVLFELHGKYLKHKPATAEVSARSLAYKKGVAAIEIDSECNGSGLEVRLGASSGHEESPESDEDAPSEDTTSLEELLLASPDDSSKPARNPSGSPGRRKSAQRSLVESLESGPSAPLPSPRGGEARDGAAEGEEVSEGPTFSLGEEDADGDGKGETPEDSDEEDVELTVEELVRIQRASRAGATPHMKKRRRIVQEPEDGQSQHPDDMSPPPPGLPPIVCKAVTESVAVGDGFRTPEKQIVDAFSSAGFYSGEEDEEDHDELEEGQVDEEGEGEDIEHTSGEGETEGGSSKVRPAGFLKDGKKKKRKARQERQRKVRFALSRNLEFEHGAAPAPTTVRTPPSCLPRGSALKPGVKPGPINMKKLISAQENSPSQMSADGRKKRKRGPVRAVGLSPPQSLSSRFAVMLQ